MFREQNCYREESEGSAMRGQINYGPLSGEVSQYQANQPTQYSVSNGAR